MRCFPGYIGRSILVLLLFLSGISSAAEPGETDRDGDKNMLRIPSGTFMMGSPDNTLFHAYPDEEKPRHSVYTDAFVIDKYEVTNSEFSEFLNAVSASDVYKNFEKKRHAWVSIRSETDQEKQKEWWPTEIVFEEGMYKASKGFEQYPVVSVSWYAAHAYCRSKGKRLPTEAEWEKAARGGLSEKDYPWGDEIPTDGVIFKRAWENNFFPYPASPVGNYYPNGYGIYDMAGNASEWCSDWYLSDYYNHSPKKNPPGPETGTSKVVRGGSWSSYASSVRVAFRNYSRPSILSSGIGFRCVKDAKE